MAEHDENDEHDEHAARAGRGEGSVERVDDPPTLPPFASDGPRPATIHGFPAVDVFGEGGLGDLFDVPKLGARVESAPVPKAAPPRLPPLASRGLKPPPTGPVPIIPPSPAATQSPVAPAPVAKRSTSDARSNAPAVREPSLGPQPRELADDANAELAAREPEPAKPASLPPPMSLIEKIRAANKRKEAEQGGDAAEGTAETKPNTTPTREPKPESRPAAAKVEPRPTPTQPPGRPAPPKPPSSTGAVAEPKPASTVAASRPAPPKPPSSTDVAAEPKPAPPKPTVAESKPAVAEPKPAVAETSKPQAPAAEGDKVWLEPVPLLSLERRHEAQASAPPTVAAGIPTEIPATSTPPAATSGDTSSEPEPEPDEDAETVVAAKPTPTQPATKPDEDAETVVAAKPTVRIGSSLPTQPATKPVLAPPPPTSAGRDEHQPKVGAPYEPPALVLERSEDPLASAPDASEEPHPPEPDTESARPRPALPIPGNRRPPPDRINPIVAARLAASAGEPTVGPTIDPLAESDAVVEPITPQDTASLVRGLADEIIAEHQPEPAAISAADATTLEIESAFEYEGATDRRRKFALYFLGVAAVLSLIVALLPSNDGPGETEPTPEEVAQASEPEPSTGDPTLLAEAQPPEPVPVPVPVPQEPVPAGDTEAGTQTAGEKPAPVTSAKPKTKPTKPEPEPVPEPPKPAPKPTPKPTPEPKPSTPTPGGPDDKRSADELYDAAKAAYNSGRAAEAYKLAYASWRKKDKSKTAELMTLAACKLADKAKAKSSLDKVTALRRNAIKKDCQALGLSL